MSGREGRRKEGGRREGQLEHSLPNVLLSVFIPLPQIDP